MLANQVILLLSLLLVLLVLLGLLILELKFTWLEFTWLLLLRLGFFLTYDNKRLEKR